MPLVAVLFARQDGHYQRDSRCDVYDISRDALTWRGGVPCVAHPPCRAWGQLRAFAKPRPGEKELAIWAIRQVRAYGGVLEHPRGSTLWKHMGLPLPGQECDPHGGYMIETDQWRFGHRAKKMTWLYVVGCPRENLPAMPPYPPGTPACVIATRLRRGQTGWRPEVTKGSRERTPQAFAEWLVEVALRCKALHAPDH